MSHSKFLKCAKESQPTQHSARRATSNTVTASLRLTTRVFGLVFLLPRHFNVIARFLIKHRLVSVLIKEEKSLGSLNWAWMWLSWWTLKLCDAQGSEWNAHRRQCIAGSWPAWGLLFAPNIRQLCWKRRGNRCQDLSSNLILKAQWWKYFSEICYENLLIREIHYNCFSKTSQQY